MNDLKIPVPIMTAEVFSQHTGLPLGVVNAQLDRRILPVLRLGKRRVVNLEALRLIAQSQASEASIKISFGLPTKGAPNV